MIKHAIKWSNGMVMVFDQHDEQIPELQGPYDEKKALVLAASDARTVFSHGVWRPREVTDVPREQW